MENFSYIEEQKLIHKFWKVHDKIFSLPAKRYLICHIDYVIGGTTGYAYYMFDCMRFKNIKLVNYCDLSDFDFKFGDRLIVFRCILDVDIENDFYIEDNPDDAEDILPFEHISVIAQVNFFYYRQYAQLMRESLDNFHKPFTPTKIMAFERLLDKLEENKQN